MAGKRYSIDDSDLGDLWIGTQLKPVDFNG